MRYKFPVFSLWMRYLDENLSYLQILARLFFQNVHVRWFSVTSLHCVIGAINERLFHLMQDSVKFLAWVQTLAGGILLKAQCIHYLSIYSLNSIQAYCREFQKTLFNHFVSCFVLTDILWKHNKCNTNLSRNRGKRC